MMLAEHSYPRNMMVQHSPIAFLSHTFLETQGKRSTTDQEASGVYYAITKWNYYFQGTEIIVKK